MLRQGDSPSVATARLADVSKRLNAIPTFAGEYLLSLDAEFGTKLAFAVDISTAFASKKGSIRNMQKSLADAVSKGAALDKKLAAAAGKGEDTSMTQSAQAANTTLIAEYEKNLEGAIAGCVAGIAKIRADVGEAVSYAIQRQRASIATLARKTAKAGLEGILEELEAPDVEEEDAEHDAAVAQAPNDTDAAAAPPAGRESSAAEKMLEKVGSTQVSKAQQWLTSNLTGHVVKVSTATAALAVKQRMKGISFDDVFDGVTTGHKDDAATLQKVLYRVRALSDSRGAGAVPSTVNLNMMQEAVKVLADKEAVSAATVAEFEANMAIGVMRDEVLAKMAADTVPALEQLLQDAEKTVLDFYEVREKVVDVKALEKDVEALAKGDKDDKQVKIDIIEVKLKAEKANIAGLITGMLAVTRGAGDASAAADAVSSVDPAVLAELFSAADNTGLPTALAAAVETGVLHLLPCMMSADLPIPGAAHGSDAAQLAPAAEVTPIAEAAAEKEAPKAAAAKKTNAAFMSSVGNLVAVKRVNANVDDRNAKKAIAAAETALKEAEAANAKAAAEAAAEEARRRVEAAAAQEAALAAAAAELERKEAEAKAAAEAEVEEEARKEAQAVAAAAAAEAAAVAEAAAAAEKAEAATAAAAAETAAAAAAAETAAAETAKAEAAAAEKAAADEARL